MKNLYRELICEKFDNAIAEAGLFEDESHLTDSKVKNALSTALDVFTRVVNSPTADDEGYVPEEVVFAGNRVAGTTLKCPHCKLDIAVVKA